MRVVMLGHKGLPARSGGVERHVQELSLRLARLGVQVTSYDRKWYVLPRSRQGGTTPSYEQEGAGGRKIRHRWSYGINTKHLDAITHTFTALFLCWRDRPDIIHIHGVGPSLLIPLARLLHPRARIIATFHCVDRLHEKWGIVSRAMLRFGEWMMCRTAHRVIAVSETIGRYCRVTYHTKADVIPNGVTIPRAVSPQLLAAYALTPFQYVLMVTRFVPHKNIHVAIEAYRALNDTHPTLAAAYPLIIAGGSSWTDAYSRSLKDAAKDVPNVRFIGEVYGDALLALQQYAATHLSIASIEGMSIALLEAAACARPVIVSNIPENIEVTQKIAPTVKPGHVTQLIQALIALLHASQEDRDRIGAALRERVRERYDWERIAIKTKSTYEDAIQR
jgi:glycosyltransferase involved in cell wall biosynthesis